MVRVQGSLGKPVDVQHMLCGCEDSTRLMEGQQPLWVSGEGSATGTANLQSVQCMPKTYKNCLALPRLPPQLPILQQPCQFLLDMHNVRQIAESREGLVDVRNKLYVSYEDLARIVDDQQALWEYMEGLARVVDISHLLYEFEQVSARFVYVQHALCGFEKCLASLVEHR